MQFISVSRIYTAFLLSDPRTISRHRHRRAYVYVNLQQEAVSFVAKRNWLLACCFSSRWRIKFHLCKSRSGLISQRCTGGGVQQITPLFTRISQAPLSEVAATHTPDARTPLAFACTFHGLWSSDRVDSDEANFQLPRYTEMNFTLPIAGMGRYSASIKSIFVVMRHRKRMEICFALGSAKLRISSNLRVLHRLNNIIIKFLEYIHLIFEKKKYISLRNYQITFLLHAHLKISREIKKNECIPTRSQ